MNSSLGNTSVIQLPLVSSTVSGIIKVSLLTLMFVFFIFFLYFIGVILSVFFHMAQLRENPRYLLFAHMLINDALYLTLGIFVSACTVYFPLRFPVPICYILVMTLSSSFKVTPYNLAAMALERYVAICFPLRHGELCTQQKSWFVIAVIWAIGLTPNLADFIIMVSTEDKNYYTLSFICSKSVFTKTPQRKLIGDVTHVLAFSSVALIILFTYIQITRVAMTMDSGTSSASKAGKTVMLHAIQLLLCISAFSYNVIEIYYREYITFIAQVNFFLFMGLPRFLSPLIYGLRDEVIRNYIKKFLCCRPLKIAINT